MIFQLWKLWKLWNRALEQNSSIHAERFIVWAQLHFVENTSRASCRSIPGCENYVNVSFRINSLAVQWRPQTFCVILVWSPGHPLSKMYIFFGVRSDYIHLSFCVLLLRAFFEKECNPLITIGIHILNTLNLHWFSLLIYYEKCCVFAIGYTIFSKTLSDGARKSLMRRPEWQDTKKSYTFLIEDV